MVCKNSCFSSCSSQLIWVFLLCRGLIRSDAFSRAQPVQAPARTALSAHTDLCREENPCGTQLIFVCWTCAKCPKLTQEEEMTHHHHQVKKAFQCWLSSSHSICSAFFITSLQLWMLLTSKGRGWNCYARACSSLANSIKYSRKSSSLIEPKILWLNWLNQLLFLQMTIPPFLSSLFRSLSPATPPFWSFFSRCRKYKDYTKKILRVIHLPLR